MNKNFIALCLVILASGCTTQQTDIKSFINSCNENLTQECINWVASINESLDINKQVKITKFNGVWLPGINAVRTAVRLIPELKKDGINAVAFGPDIVTRGVDEPVIAGRKLFGFYVRVFENAGFNVLFVPNNMHWGNNNIHLKNLTKIIIDCARDAEKLNVEFFAVLNEVDQNLDNISETSKWLQDVLPLIRQEYSGLVCVQPSQNGFSKGLNYSGYDCISAFLPLLVPDEERNKREISKFLNLSENAKKDFPSIKFVFFSDVGTYAGGNWAETTLIEQQARSLSHGFSEYSSEAEQKKAFALFFDRAYPYIDGCFFSIEKGFSFINKSAEQEIKKGFNNSKIPARQNDSFWSMPGLIELAEKALINESEKKLIFDLETFTPGYAGLDHLPSPDHPGPFNCSSVKECMDLFRSRPDEYWLQSSLS